MLQAKLKVAVDYEKCHPERCGKGVCAAVLECPLSSGSKESHMIYPTPFRAFVRIVAHVLSLAP